MDAGLQEIMRKRRVKADGGQEPQPAGAAAVGGAQPKAAMSNDLQAIMERRRKMEESSEVSSSTMALESSRKFTSAGPIDKDLQAKLALRRQNIEGGSAPEETPHQSKQAGSGNNADIDQDLQKIMQQRRQQEKGGSAQFTRSRRSPRLHVDAAILGYQRGLRTQNNHVSLIKIKGVDSTEVAQFYLGKKVLFLNKTKTGGMKPTWGKVRRTHGSNGVVRCTFARNLPPQAIGGRVRVMLYPSNV
jgi:large subunit ribosomal protein L35Ae